MLRQHAAVQRVAEAGPGPISPAMSILTPIPPATPWPQRALFSIPLIGWIARDIAFRDADNIWYALMIVLTLLILAVSQWGLVAIVVTYVTFVVPAMMALLVRLAWG